MNAVQDTFDLVVVGHGAAGLAAALAAAEAAPQARIVVLEQASPEQCGGGTRWSPANLRMQSVHALAPDFLRDMHMANGARHDADYFECLAKEAPATLQWVQAHGVQFHAPGYYLSAGPPRIQPQGGGASIVSGLMQAAHAAGVTFWYGCRAEQLRCDASGAIIGIDITQYAKRRSLHTPRVVLASGGFQGNPDMLREHLGAGAETLRPISPGSAMNDGVGIRMAQAIGAHTSGNWAGMHSEPVDARSTASAPVVLVYPYGIVVDQAGQRFIDEGAGLVHETWEYFSRDIHFKTAARQAWAILDARALEIPGLARAVRSDVAPIQAQTLDALAQHTGIDRAGLQATVRAYNAACLGDTTHFDATRVDGLASASHLQPPKSNWACPIERAPFIAYPLVGAIAYTFGGLATDTQARVLRAGTHATPIAGLFAAGEITGHFYDSAPNAVAVLRALVFGRIAGRIAMSTMIQTVSHERLHA